MQGSIAVLSSGGLDSCVLLADLARKTKVYPLYIPNGLIWEKEELKALHAFIRALGNHNVQTVTKLLLPVHSLYGNHWSLSGFGIPSAQDADSKIYLPGRNVLLLSLAGVWCSLNDVSRLAIGTLSTNPFPDATADFFTQFGKTLSAGLSFQINIEAPFREKYKKEDLIRDHQALPLELSLTCLAPRAGKHCGVCNKCRERQIAYKAAGVPDRTIYAKKRKGVLTWN